MGMRGAVALEVSPWYAPWMAPRRAVRRRRRARRMAGLAVAGFVLSSLLTVVDRVDLARGSASPPRDRRRAARSSQQRLATGAPLAESPLAHLGLAAARTSPVRGMTGGANHLPLPDRTFDLPAATDPLVVDFVSGREVLRGDEETGAIALTFDCEGTGQDLEAVLDLLAEHDARGTFFLIARMAAWWPEAATRVVSGGHQLASHGSRHEDYTTLSPEQIVEDLVAFEVAMADALKGARIVPPPVRFFRFPYGSRNEATLAEVAAAGYQSVHWTIDPRGWRADRTPEQVEAIVAEHAAPGEILLMHCSAAADRAALPAVLSLLAERGLRTATISEIVRWDDLPIAVEDFEDSSGAIDSAGPPATDVVTESPPSTQEPNP